MNKTKLRKILDVLSPEGTSVDFKEFDKNVEALKKGLKEKIQAKTLDDVNNRLESFRKRLDLTAVTTGLKTLESALEARVEAVEALIEEEFNAYNKLSVAQAEDTSEKLTETAGNIAALKGLLDSLKIQKDTDVSEIRQSVESLKVFSGTAGVALSDIQDSITILKDKVNEPHPSFEDLETIKKEIERLERELLNRINNIPRGGNANRNIAIGGNVNALQPFTDINLKAGSNVTITYTPNQTTKYLDVTISATGGGGGTTRSVNNISSDTTAGDTDGTDYVYVCTGTLTLTLPTAIGNDNLYTVKNAGNGTITVATTGGQTIDDDSTVVMPVKYTSVDLISNGSNWQIT